MRALAEAGIVRTFAIQELTLPLALAGEDIIGQARTGMGKTLGFGVPLLQRVVPPSEQPAANAEGEAADRTKDVPQALVVVPTRELCVQVAKDIADAGKHLGVRVTAIYGGRAYEPQLAALRKGVDVVVGTPGRLLDLAEQRHLVLGRVKALVLDEADEMLDLGFLPDVERIMRMLPEQRHTMLFSATMPGPIIALSRAFLNRPTHIRAEEADQGSIHERTRQLVYRAHAMDKVELLTRVLQAKDRGLTMIFARTKRTVQRVADDLADRGFAAAAVHGDLGQGAREQALRAFRSGKVDVLVATDVAARGIDVTDVTHVINYQCPEDAKTYVHRIGRTGRAGKEGVAVTLVDWDELPRWKMISDDLGLGMPEAAGDLLHLRAPLHRPRHPDQRQRAAAALAAHPGRAGRRVRRHRAALEDGQRRPRARHRGAGRDLLHVRPPLRRAGDPHHGHRPAAALQRTRAGLDAEYVDPELDHGGRKRGDRVTGRDRKRGDDRAEDAVLAPRGPRRARDAHPQPRRRVGRRRARRRRVRGRRHRVLRGGTQTQRSPEPTPASPRARARQRRRDRDQRQRSPSGRHPAAPAPPPRWSGPGRRPGRGPGGHRAGRAPRSDAAAS